MSQAERLALRNLRRRTDVVIKPADKGELLSFGHALFTSKRLKNSCLTKDSTRNLALIHYKIVNEMVATCALPPSAKNLVVTTPHTSRFYLLPKIHKPNNPGRMTDSIGL